jgi:hypothetical protein
MRENGVYEKPGKAFADQGQVMLDGPDGIAVSMTPEAAEGTAHELLRAASDAKAQRALSTS